MNPREDLQKRKIPRIYDNGSRNPQKVELEPERIEDLVEDPRVELSILVSTILF